MEEKKILEILNELNQNEILEKYEKVSEEERKAFIQDFNRLDKVCVGGIKDYVHRAKVLFKDRKNDFCALGDYVPRPPEDYIKINVGDEAFYNLEKIGFEVLKDCTFCLVAGGLGERLGYSDIKIGLQTELVTKRPFLELYIDYIKAYEERIKKIYNPGKDWFIPFAIMTSDDTHEKTVAFLKKNNNFGLKEGQIVLIKQEKVPAFLDDECHLALQKDKFLIETKPHGHGDVHSLIYSSGLSKKWADEGKKYLIIFQDTNILIFNCVLSTLGASVKYNYTVNAVCVKRKSTDFVSAACEMVKKDGSKILKFVEYSQLNGVLKAGYNPEGDVPDEEGISKFPGNINIFAINIPIYNEALDKTKGKIPEFVNPKYSDNTRTKFKTPSRLEAYMQELTVLFKEGERTGITFYDRWFCFSACKNDLISACKKYTSGQNPESAWSTERDFFLCNVKLLKEVLGKLEIEQTEPQNEVVVNGIKLQFGPKIILYPSFAISLSELKEKLALMKGQINMTNNSTLILKNDIVIQEGIDLDGTLVIDKEEKEKVECKNKERRNYYSLKEGEGEIFEQIRGYTMISK